MNLENLDPRISSQNRNKIESSGLLLDESIDYAVEQCNLLFEDWMKNRNNLDEANEVVAGFLDEYFLPQQLNYEIYSIIWTNLTDENFLDGFVNSLSDQNKSVLKNYQVLINPSLYKLFIKSLNFHYLKTRENTRRFGDKIMVKPLDVASYIKVFNSFEKSYLKNSYGMTLWQVKQLKEWENNPPSDMTKEDFIFFVNK